jgi:hypothetical protein
MGDMPELDPDDKIWIPYEELQVYLTGLSNSLKEFSESIKHTLAMIEENASKQKEAATNE